MCLYIFCLHFINRFTANPEILIRQFFNRSHKKFLRHIHNFRRYFCQSLYPQFLLPVGQSIYGILLLLSLWIRWSYPLPVRQEVIVLSCIVKETVSVPAVCFRHGRNHCKTQRLCQPIGSSVFRMIRTRTYPCLLIYVRDDFFYAGPGGRTARQTACGLQSRNGRKRPALHLPVP